MRRTYTCAACHSVNSYDQFLLTDGKVKCPNCHSIMQVQTSSISEGVGAIVGLVLLIPVVMWLWDGFWWLVGWIIDIVLWPFVMMWKACVWIYNIVAWPFIKIWMISEMSYTWIIGLLGFQHNVVWWEILIYMASVIVVISFVWALAVKNTNK